MKPLEKPKKSKTHMCQKELISRGWTKTLINKYGGDPELVTNSKFRRAAPMKLYLISHVIETEQNQDFLRDKIKTDKSRKSANKAVKTKTDRLIFMIQSLEVKIQIYPNDWILKQALTEQQNFYDRVNKNDSVYTAGNLTKERWCVNYIRHNLCDYDKDLELLFNKTGKNQGYELLKTRILSEIAICYPKLAEECGRQITRTKELLALTESAK